MLLLTLLLVAALLYWRFQSLEEQDGLPPSMLNSSSPPPRLEEDLEEQIELGLPSIERLGPPSAPSVVATEPAPNRFIDRHLPQRQDPPLELVQEECLRILMHELTEIQPGQFTMGWIKERDSSREDLLHSVRETRITYPYWMASTPVQQRLYRAFVPDFSCPDRGDKLPATGMNWFEALRFCNTLTLALRKLYPELEGWEPVYQLGSFQQDDLGRESTTVQWNTSALGFRLPTEAEWEYAARAGGSYRFAGSNRLDRVGWYGGMSTQKGNSPARPSRVKRKRPNAWGLYDMSGNVAEWCWDWYQPDSELYQAEPASNPLGPPTGRCRVVRGGHWGAGMQSASSASRSFEPPDHASKRTQGMRLVFGQVINGLLNSD